jgi:hypothetical protein
VRLYRTLRQLLRHIRRLRYDLRDGQQWAEAREWVTRYPERLQPLPPSEARALVARLKEEVLDRPLGNHWYLQHTPQRTLLLHWRVLLLKTKKRVVMTPPEPGDEEVDWYLSSSDEGGEGGFPSGGDSSDTDPSGGESSDADPADADSADEGSPESSPSAPPLRRNPKGRRRRRTPPGPGCGGVPGWCSASAGCWSSPHPWRIPSGGRRNPSASGATTSTGRGWPTAWGGNWGRWG